MDKRTRAVTAAAAALVTTLATGSAVAKDPIEEAFVKDATAAIKTIEVAERGGFGLGGGGGRISFEQGPGRDISDREAISGLAPELDGRRSEALTFENGLVPFNGNAEIDAFEN